MSIYTEVIEDLKELNAKPVKEKYYLMKFQLGEDHFEIKYEQNKETGGYTTHINDEQFHDDMDAVEEYLKEKMKLSEK